MSTVAKVGLVRILFRWANLCNSTLLSTESNTEKKIVLLSKEAMMLKKVFPFEWNLMLRHSVDALGMLLLVSEACVKTHQS